MRENEFEWNQFIRLGEMIGDGLHYEDPWISKEYKRLAKILVPITDWEKDYKAEIRRKKNENTNKQIEERLKTDTCSKCQSVLKQVRSGSKVVQCINEQCKAKFQYKTKRK